MTKLCCGFSESLEHNQSFIAIPDNTNTVTDDDSLGQFKFVSDYVAFLFNVIVYALLSGCVSVVGMAANILNIIIFIRQGAFNESSSVSLLALAVSDLCSVATMLWMSVSFSIVLAEPKGLSWVPYDVAYVSAVWPHIMSAQITRMITAFVAFERCICVVFPFKVKSLFTPKRSFIVVVSIFVYCLLSYSPMFVVHQLQHKTDPVTNETRLSLVFTEHRQLVVDIVSYINYVVFNNGSVAVVLLCTMITVSRVKLSKAWRESVTTTQYGTTTTTAGGKSEYLDNQKTGLASTINQKKNIATDNNSSAGGVNKIENNNETFDKKKNSKTSNAMQKEKRLVRMITLISVIFLICYCPDLTFLIMISVNKDIHLAGQYKNLAHVMYSLTFLMESINSSINILVYYNMSSKYKKEFQTFLRSGLNMKTLG